MDDSQLVVEKEQLIEAVRSRPSIWDMSMPNYKDIHIRRRLWMEILKELGVPQTKENVKTFSKKFTSLKYRYQQWLQGTSASGSGGAAKEFPCARLLSFLNDSLKPRMSTSLWNSVEIDLENETIPNSSEIIYQDVEHLHDFEEINKMDLTSQDVDLFLQGDHSHLDEETQDKKPTSSSKVTAKNPKRKQEDQALGKLKIKRESLELKKQFLNSRNVPPNDTKRFFCDMLYEDIKDMNMAKFRILRTKILKLVDDSNADNC